MKAYVTTFLFFLIVLLFSQCNNSSDEVVENNKDLGQNMLDMMMYHDNLGTELRKGQADDASWFLEGMDSSLKVIAAKYDKHRKLTVPFEKTYRNKMQPPIAEIRNALAENNFPNAINAYRILTKNCNGCHADHDVNEEVFDLTEAAKN